jgi:F0F1-type ATP synthase epsilon subunit
MSDKVLIKVNIRNTEEILFDGEVDRITSYNEVGRFDVYPMHANFISIIEKELTLYHNKEKLKEIKLERAVMKVKQDIVHIYLGIEALLMGEEGALASPEEHTSASQPAK